MKNTTFKKLVLKNLVTSVAAVSLVGGAHAVSTKIGDTTLTIGGHIKANALWSDFEDGTRPDNIGQEILVPSTIPVGNEDASEGFQFDSHINTSRLGFKTSTPTDNGTVKTNFEFDLLSSASLNGLGNERISNSSVFRVRHAYFSWDYSDSGSLLVGQSWSTFFNVGALPESVDFIGPTSGSLFNRQWQVRWTKKAGSGKFMLALENPSTSIYNDGNDIDDNTIPDIVARYDGKSGGFNWSLAGIIREIALEDTSIGFDDEEYGFAVSFAGKIALGGKDDIKFMISSGTLGRYIALNAFRDAYIDGDELETVDVTGGFVAYRHWWNSKTRSTFQYAMSTADIDSELAAQTFLATGESDSETVSNFEISLITSPTKNLDFGAGYIYAERELENDVDGNLTRLQFFGKLKF